MKRIYLVKKDEHLPTSQDNWIEMNALQFAAFLETDAGQRRRNRFLQLNNTLVDDEVIFMNVLRRNIPSGKKSGKVNFTRTAGKGSVDIRLLRLQR